MPAKRKTLAWLGLACCILAGIGLGQARSPYRGVPFYRIYSNEDMFGNPSFYCLESSPDNTLYCSNERGLLAFDGTSWKEAFKDEAITERIRSLAWFDGKAYVGSYGSIGQLVRDDSAGLRFQELQRTLNPAYPSEYYGKAHPTSECIYFVGGFNLAKYWPRTNRVETIELDTWITASFTNADDLYVATREHGLMLLKDEGLVPLELYHSFRNERAITRAATTPAGQVAIATANGELYAFTPEGPTPILQDFVESNGAEILDIAFVNESELALSTADKSLWVYNTAGHLESSISQRTAPLWDNAEKLHVDQHGTIWALFPKGIAKLLSSRAATSIEPPLRPQIFYASVHAFDGNLYLRNKNNLYIASADNRGALSGFDLLISEADKTCSYVVATPEGLMINGKTRFHLYTGSDFQDLGSFEHTDRFIPFREQPELILATNAKGLQLLERSASGLALIDELEGKIGLVNKIAEEQPGVFWLELGIGRLGKVTVSNRKLHYRPFSAQDGLPAAWIAIWPRKHRVDFTSRSGVHVYDAQEERFHASHELDAYLTLPNAPIHRAATDQEGNIWLSYGFANYILWKKDDGSYQVDAQTLSPLGEDYFNNIEFLPNGDVIMLSESKMFHVDKDKLQPPAPHASTTLSISEIRDLSAGRHYFPDTYAKVAGEMPSLAKGKSTLLFCLSNTKSSELADPQYSYLLEGFSDTWSAWTTNNQLHFINLAGGKYTLKIRSRFGNYPPKDEISYAFAIEPRFYESPIAFVTYAFAAVILVGAGYWLVLRNLRLANQKLERLVEERTREIETQKNTLELQAEVLEGRNLELATKSEELEENAGRLAATIEQLQNTQDKLIAASRTAGMAEVATSVLHNVGNVLTSINVTASNLSQRMASDKLEKLQQLSDLIKAHTGQLDHFFTKDPRGLAVPAFLEQLASVSKSQGERNFSDLASLQSNIDHIKRIIASQQSLASSNALQQSFKLAELIESARHVVFPRGERSPCALEIRVDPQLEIETDKHKLLQVLTNLIKNAKEAVAEGDAKAGFVRVEAVIVPSKNQLQITIQDNGVGIAPEIKERIFIHGFTTKQDGHGFGMHSCANTIKALGGSIRLDSEGVGRGATVSICLPLNGSAGSI